MKSLLFFLIIFLLIVPSSAFTMEVAGDNIQGKTITVTLDREAFTAFTLNNATPVYAYGSEVKFIPVRTGTLTITSICGAEKLEKVVNIHKSETGEPSGGDDEPSKWQTVTVSDGQVLITTCNSQKTYSVDCLTVLGALDASGIPYTASDEEWGGDGLFIKSIDGIEGVLPEGWMYQINGVMGGPAEYSPVRNGDEIIFYYSKSMSETPKTSDHCIYLKIHFAGTNTGDDSGGSGGYNDNPSQSAGSVTKTSGLAITLPEGATLSIDKFGQIFTIDREKARFGGEKISYDGNNIIINRGAFDLIIHLKDYNEKNNILTGRIDRVMLNAAPFRREIKGVGNVTSSFSAELNGVPVDASINVLLSGNISENLRNTFCLCAMDNSRCVSDIAYVMQVDTGKLRDGPDIGTATVNMTISPGWVEAHGGKDAIIILHQKTDGTVEALTTRFVAYAENGNMIFTADSPGGLSIFALAASGVSVTSAPTVTESQNETVPYSTSSSPEQWSWTYFGIGILIIGGGLGGLIIWYRRQKHAS